MFIACWFKFIINIYCNDNLIWYIHTGIYIYKILYSIIYIVVILIVQTENSCNQLVLYLVR